ncbi:MAG: Na+/H+ antiporter subunit E [Clostridia bacterium]|nr:Na+/H+ antiporter subunit E [Clostridia bacterium]
MYFLLFGFWVLLNGRWTTEIALVGVIVCAALYAFMCMFMGYSPKKEWQLLRRGPRIIGYALYLVGEIFKSSWATICLIWSPEKEIEPRVTSFHTRLKTDAGKVVLANSITMTPGTITVDVQDDLFLIHCLDESFDVGQEGFEMEDRIMKVEALHPGKEAADHE